MIIIISCTYVHTCALYYNPAREDPEDFTCENDVSNARTFTGIRLALNAANGVIGRFNGWKTAQI